MTLGELARQIGIPAARCAGIEEREVFGVASLSEAGPEELSFFSDRRYLKALEKTRALAVLAPESFEDEAPVPVIRCPNLPETLQRLLAHFTPPPVTRPPGIHPSAIVSPGAKIDPSASILPLAVIEEGVEIGARSVIGPHCCIGHRVRIGEDCFLHPRVTVGDRCILGNRVILHSGVVVGSDGFGYQLREGRREKVPQTGIAQIDDDVEIGANSTVDRARFGRTHIAEGVKIDNLVQIAHNVQIGRDSVICALSGISGSVRIGPRATLAGKVGVNGHIEIGEGTTVAAMSGVVHNLPPGGIFAGLPVQPIREFKRNYAHLHGIHKLYARVAALEKERKQPPPSAS